MDIYRAEPKGTPRGAIVVIQEIFGVNTHIREVTDGFAADGYLAIAPAMFDRYEVGVELGYTPETIVKGRALKNRVSHEEAIADVEAAIAQVAGAGRVGIVGYCWGGFVTWLAAVRARGLACAVPYYGGGILEHAVDETWTPRVPVLAHFGERDAMIPADGVRALAARYPAAQIHLYAADHGFNCDHRGSYDAAAAALARERTLAFFREHVG
jgi:carboxymethylenebutenolidase